MSIQHKLTSKAQVTIPKDVRAVLGVKPGDMVRFESDAQGRVTLSKGNDAEVETKAQRSARIRAALEAAAGKIDLGGMTTDQYMRKVRGDWEP
ncbi:MAG: AbrB/MazE/SpoVT family DNA-binding domain-containing protein [Sphingomonadaceae bacterium]